MLNKGLAKDQTIRKSPPEIFSNLFLSDIDLRKAKMSVQPMTEPEFRSDSLRKESKTFDEFSKSLINGMEKQVVGIYCESIFSLQVMKQPDDEPTFISDDPNSITEFRLAATHGTLGYLAHNYLAGKTFFDVPIGQSIFLINGNGGAKEFLVEELKRFQALQPNSPHSEFVDLESGHQQTSSELFYKIYDNKGKAVLQTCIEQFGIDTWGRLFIVASPKS